MGKNKDRLLTKSIPWADSILDQVMNLPAAGGEDLQSTAEDQTTAVEDLLKMVNRKIAMNNGEGQYVWKKCKLEQVTITNPSVVMNSGSGKIKVTTTDDIDLSLVDLSFFDGFVSNEPYKFYTQNGQLYFYSTDYPVTAYNTETHELTSNAGISNTTFTYTGTKEIPKLVFEDYVVADDESVYPNGGELDGYWYELVEEGVSGIAFGEVTVSSATSIVVAHGLDVTPRIVALIGQGNQNTGNATTNIIYPAYAYNGNPKSLVTQIYRVTESDIGINLGSVGSTTMGAVVNEQSISFYASYSSNAYPFRGTYTWVAIP